ncbi:MaoC family dehydratase [Caproiciproducens sp. NJN-50]|uniref:MaoC family dehydratase n=1 Tax=Acutalibacteraceae TaxID=3082771 RepID=UPI000FFE2171|nr:MULTISPECIES: MaoC family dehydratase [Acutalibacteraceae]QAT48834.1 MaoC family dehydratase [Caproiciproducens sp. NJN-50]
MTIDELKIGDSASVSKTVSESDVYLFAGITGDFNSAHVNEEAAKEGVFHRRVAHGMLTASFFSTVLGTKLPGPGSIYLGQEVRFVKPVYLGDTITASVTVSEINPEKRIVKLDTVCKNQEDVVVVEGRAIVRPPKK